MNVQGSLALQFASVGGHREIVELLIEMGADVNAHGGKYGCVLHGIFRSPDDCRASD